MGQLPTSTPRSQDPAELRRALDMMDFFAGMVEAAALPRRKAGDKDATIPVVILTGFLGAGKTTLMRHLLTATHGMKIAALVNDFAALNIDASLIADVSGDTTALANGCVCCSLSGSLARSLADIADRDISVDAVLIEASGVSDPWGIAQVVQTVDGVALDNIVAVVDAAGRDTEAGMNELLHRQVSAANLVLLNKTDLITRSEAAVATKRLAALAPRAQILRTMQCAVPPVVVFDSIHELALNGPQTTEHLSDQFTTLVMEARTPVARVAFEKALSSLPDGILRIKGFLRLSDAPEVLVLCQAVGRRWSWQSAPGQDSPTRLVIIGQTGHMSLDAVQRHFEGSDLQPVWEKHAPVVAESADDRHE